MVGIGRGHEIAVLEAAELERERVGEKRARLQAAMGVAKAGEDGGKLIGELRVAPRRYRSDERSEALLEPVSRMQPVGRRTDPVHLPEEEIEVAAPASLAVLRR